MKKTVTLVLFCLSIIGNGFSSNSSDEVSGKPDDAVFIQGYAIPLMGGTVTGYREYEYNSEVVLLAEENPGFYFTGWEEEGEIVSVSPEYIFTATEDRDIYAVFIPEENRKSEQLNILCLPSQIYFSYECDYSGLPVELRLPHPPSGTSVRNIVEEEYNEEYLETNCYLEIYRDPQRTDWYVGGKHDIFNQEIKYTITPYMETYHFYYRFTTYNRFGREVNAFMGDLRYDTSSGLDFTGSRKDFLIHPNPVKTDFTIQSDKPVERIEIFSYAGDLLMKETNVKNKINVSALPAGVYIVRIHSGNHEEIQKIIITK